VAGFFKDALRRKEINMDIHISLYEGRLIRLSSINYEKDTAIESKWTHDAEYLRLLDTRPARPVSPAEMKKKYEALEKGIEESKNQFYFTIRLRSDDPEQNDRLIGFARLYEIEWNHGVSQIILGIGDPGDRRKGYGSDAMNLLLRYAFAELNLFRLSALIPAYNTGALRLFEKAGFIQEVRRRQALNRDGRYWDLIHVGLLRDEWHGSSSGEAA
jgi:RimJ/RimL family protein N-acetyltransferase